MSNPNKKLPTGSMVAALDQLKRWGCYPVIAYRGSGIWRVHINGAGNSWAEDERPFEALLKAFESWKARGYPKDGYASVRSSVRSSVR